LPATVFSEVVLRPSSLGNELNRMKEITVSTKPATPVKKAPKQPTLKQLIARTEKIADDATALLGALRQLDNQGFVITTLLSGKTTKSSA